LKGVCSKDHSSQHPRIIAMPRYPSHQDVQTALTTVYQMSTDVTATI
jgi:hypothetical protein